MWALRCQPSVEHDDRKQALLLTPQGQRGGHISKARFGLVRDRSLVGGLGEVAAVAVTKNPTPFQQLGSAGEITDEQKR